MRFIGFDTETFKFEAHLPQPPVVCLTVSLPDGSAPSLFGPSELSHAWRCLLQLAEASPEVVLVAHNASFDVLGLCAAVPDTLPLALELLERGQVHCTALRDQLIAIGTGTLDREKRQRFVEVAGVRRFFDFSLASCALLHFGERVSKDEADTGRTSFGSLYYVPPSAWPEYMWTYALADAVLVRRLAEHQQQHYAELLQDAAAQTRASVALRTCRNRGFRTDAARIAQVEASADARIAKVQQQLVNAGLLRDERIKRDGTKKPVSVDTKACGDVVLALAAELGRDVKMTSRGVSLDYDTLMSLHDEKLLREASGWQLSADGTKAYDLLQSLIEFNDARKFRTFVEGARAGAGASALHSEPNTLVANGRTSWTAPNLQQLPQLAGARECFVARPGHVLFSCDYSTLELCTVAQCCLWLFGRSRLAELINGGADMHSMLGELWTGIPSAEIARRKDDGDEYCEAVRNACKRGNFGFWGGMGIKKFMLTNSDMIRSLAKVGVVFDERACKKLKAAWQAMLPESRDYFALADGIAKGDRRVQQFVSGRWRGDLDMPAAANTFFSGLAADGAKRALWNVVRNSYVRDASAPTLYDAGVRTLVFIHDELLGEVPDGPLMHEAVHEVAAVMRNTMQAYVPDVTIKTSLAVMRVWRKSAKPYFVDGRIRPYEESSKFVAAVTAGKELA